MAPETGRWKRSAGARKGPRQLAMTRQTGRRIGAPIWAIPRNSPPAPAQLLPSVAVLVDDGQQDQTIGHEPNQILRRLVLVPGGRDTDVEAVDALQPKRSHEVEKEA